MIYHTITVTIDGKGGEGGGDDDDNEEESGIKVNDGNSHVPVISRRLGDDCARHDDETRRTQSAAASTSGSKMMIATKMMMQRQEAVGEKSTPVACCMNQSAITSQPQSPSSIFAFLHHHQRRDEEAVASRDMDSPSLSLHSFRLSPAFSGSSGKQQLFVPKRQHDQQQDTITPHYSEEQLSHSSPEEPTVSPHYSLRLRLPPPPSAPLPDGPATDSSASSRQRLYGSAEQLSRLLSGGGGGCDRNQAAASPTPTVSSLKSVRELRKPRSASLDWKPQPAAVSSRASAHDLLNGRLWVSCQPSGAEAATPSSHLSPLFLFSPSSSSTLHQTGISTITCGQRSDFLPPPACPITVDSDITKTSVCTCSQMPPPPPPLQFTRYYCSQRKQEPVYAAGGQEVRLRPPAAISAAGTRVWSSASAGHPLKLTTRSTPDAAAAVVRRENQQQCFIGLAGNSMRMMGRGQEAGMVTKRMSMIAQPSSPPRPQDSFRICLNKRSSQPTMAGTTTKTIQRPGFLKRTVAAAGSSHAHDCLR